MANDFTDIYKKGVGLGYPQPSQATMLSQRLSKASPLLSGFFGASGQSQDRQALEQYRAEQDAQKRQQQDVGALSKGIDIQRLQDQDYRQGLLKAKSTPDIKGEFGYALALRQSPKYQTMKPQEQKWLDDYIGTKAKGFDTLQGQAYATGAGKGQADLRYAQPVERQKAIGRQLLTETPTGELQFIKGSKGDIEAQEKAKTMETRKQADILQSSTGLGDVNKTLEMVKNKPYLFGDKFGIAGVARNITNRQEAVDAERFIESIKGTAGMTELINMKRQGGTLGAIPQSQFDMLASLKGEINPTMSPASLKDNLNRQKIIYTAIMEDRPMTGTEAGFMQFKPEIMQKWGNEVEGLLQQSRQPQPQQGRAVQIGKYIVEEVK